MNVNERIWNYASLRIPHVLAPALTLYKSARRICDLGNRESIHVHSRSFTANYLLHNLIRSQPVVPGHHQRLYPAHGVGKVADLTLEPIGARNLPCLPYGHVRRHIAHGIRVVIDEARTGRAIQLDHILPVRGRPAALDHADRPILRLEYTGRAVLYGELGIVA